MVFFPAHPLGGPLFSFLLYAGINPGLISTIVFSSCEGGGNPFFNFSDFHSRFNQNGKKTPSKAVKIG
jgi:hypothetical protein